MTQPIAMTKAESSDAKNAGDDGQTALNRIVLVTGVPGCGKDFLLTKAGLELSKCTPPRVTSFGERLYSALHQGTADVRDRDDIRDKLTTSDIRTVAIEIAANITSSQPLLVNSHVLFRQLGDLVIQPDVHLILRPAVYIYVWAAPSQIVSWRSTDSSRVRPNQNASEIALHQQLNEAVVRSLALQFGSRFVRLVNNPSNLSENVETICKEYNEVIGGKGQQWG